MYEEIRAKKPTFSLSLALKTLCMAITMPAVTEKRIPLIIFHSPVQIRGKILEFFEVDYLYL